MTRSLGVRSADFLRLSFFVKYSFHPFKIRYISNRLKISTYYGLLVLLV